MAYWSRVKAKLQHLPIMRNRTQYRWLIALTCYLMMFLLIGLGHLPSSLYIVPVTEYYGFSRGDFSLIFTLQTIATMIISYYYGNFLIRFGIRSLMIFGSILAPIAYAIFSTASTLPVFYVAGMILGISLSLASHTTSFILIHNWFDNWQGALVGFISAGTGLGGSLFSLIIGKQITQNGFKTAYLLTAIILAFASIPVILFIRSSPSEMTEKSDDQSPENYAGFRTTSSKISTQILFTNDNYLFALLAVFFIGMGIHSILVCTPAYLVDKGFDLFFTAGVSSGIFFTLALAKIFVGFLLDKLGIKISLILGIGSYILCSVLLIIAMSEWLIWLYVILLGFALVTQAVSTPFYAMTLMGKENYTKFLGVFLADLSAGQAIGVSIMNYSYDFLGSYSFIIGAFAGLGIIALLLVTKSLR
jgi:MFS family permease